MSDFDLLIKEWQNFSPSMIADSARIDEIICAAELAKGAPGYLWADFQNVLMDHTGWKESDVKNEVSRCRIVADLGRNVFWYNDFIEAFLTSRGYKYLLTDQFCDEHGGVYDTDYIANELSVWAGDFQKFTNVEARRGAWENWRFRERSRLLKLAYQEVQYDPAADPTALSRYVRLILEPNATEAAVHAFETTLRGFIYRIKNHMRGKWVHKAHLMPILYGKQGSGKTTSVEHFLGPINGCWSVVGFEVFKDNSKQMQLTTEPVMFFDEMANVNKAEVEIIKNMMTTPSRQMRQIYKAASNRMLISTFIGCTNRDIRTLIKDETGNRRFIQFTCRNVINLAALRAIDPLVLWRSVNEDDAASPILKGHTLDEAIQSEQATQRTMSVVEEWIHDGSGVPFNTWAKATELFAEFHFWKERCFPNSKQFDARSFGIELTRLKNELDYPIRIKSQQNSNRYFIERLHDDRNMEGCIIDARQAFGAERHDDAVPATETNSPSPSQVKVQAFLSDMRELGSSEAMLSKIIKQRGLGGMD